MEIKGANCNPLKTSCQCEKRTVLHHVFQTKIFLSITTTIMQNDPSTLLKGFHVEVNTVKTLI